MVQVPVQALLFALCGQTQWTTPIPETVRAYETREYLYTRMLCVIIYDEQFARLKEQNQYR